MAMAEVSSTKKKMELKIVIETFDKKTSFFETEDKIESNVASSTRKTSKPSQKGLKKSPFKRNLKKHPLNSTTEDESTSPSPSESDTGATKMESTKLKTQINPNLCRFCGKYYRSLDELKEHETKHITNKEMFCPDCGVGIARRSYLAEHACVHSGARPHPCYYCNQSFALKCNLVRHVRIHTGEKPFACDICKKKFILKKNMIEHKRTHTGEKPFHCDSCDLSFSRRSSLVRHLRIHTGEKYYECYDCGKKFPWKYYLQRHMRATHLKDESSKRTERRSNKNKNKGGSIISQPVQLNKVKCEPLSETPTIFTDSEQVYTVNNLQMNDTVLKIKEELEETEEFELKDEVYEHEEKIEIIEGPEVSPPPEEQKRLTVLVTPVITSSYSLAKIFTVPPANDSIVSDFQDGNLKINADESKLRDRKLRIVLHRLEEYPVKMLVE